MRHLILWAALMAAAAPGRAGLAADCTPVALEGRWNIVRFDGEQIADRAEIGFVMGARLAAHLGCNRMVGDYTLAHGVLRAGPMAATRMACPAALMARDDRFSAMISAGAACRITPEGALHLGRETTPDLIATPMATPASP